MLKNKKILLDCDQPNVLFARIIFFCIFKKLFRSVRLVLETRRLIETHLILY